jgi:hypothetical protein
VKLLKFDFLFFLKKKKWKNDGVMFLEKVNLKSTSIGYVPFFLVVVALGFFSPGAKD